MFPPEEWKRRTSLTFSRRGPTTLLVDAAYSEYFAVRTEKNAEKLYFLLEKYLHEHGGKWTKADRNLASGGLMAGIWELAMLHAHPGLGRPKFSEAELEAIEFWKGERQRIAQRFFKDCRLEIKGGYTQVKLPVAGRTGITVVEVGKTGYNAYSIAEGAITVNKLVKHAAETSVHPSVLSEVLRFLQSSGIITEMVAHTASSLIPFKNVITSGGIAIKNGIQAAVDVYRRYDSLSHQNVLDEGTPQAAFSSMIIIIERERTKHLTAAAQATVQAAASAVAQVFDPTQTSQAIISAAGAIASLTQRIFLIGRDFLERYQANKILADPEKIDSKILATHPILGCYLLVGAEMSTLIAFFGRFGYHGWMDEIELAVKAHLTPLQDRAGGYIDDCRFKLLRDGNAVYAAPGAWRRLKKWKNGRWDPPS